MTARIQIATLVKEIEKSERVLKRLSEYYNEYTEKSGDQKGTEQAIVISDIIVNYYTCLETIFLRISQHFENHLDGKRWHADLLSKMTLEIDGVRKAVITDSTHALLVELMKFRHFKRYYFDLNYDWDKLEFLQRKMGMLMPVITGELSAFKCFLAALQDALDE